MLVLTDKNKANNRILILDCLILIYETFMLNRTQKYEKIPI